MSLSSLEFTGLGMNFTGFPDLDTAPSPAKTFEETFLFFGMDLLSNGDWSLTGDLTFGSLSGNPSEGSKITVKLRDASVLPEPGALLLAAAAAMAALAVRRRA